jgi:hypothetical protein
MGHDRSKHELDWQGASQARRRFGGIRARTGRRHQMAPLME